MAWAYDQTAKYVGAVTAVPNYDSPYTMSLWLRLNATPDDFFSVVQLYAGAADYELLVVDNAGMLKLQIVYGGSLEEYDFGKVDDGGWHHVVVARTASDRVTGYLDGATAGELVLSGTRSIANNVLYFGCFAGAFFFLDGDIDCVKIWNSALSTNAALDEGTARDIFIATAPQHWFDPALGDFKLTNFGTEGTALAEVGGTIPLSDGPPILAYPRQPHTRAIVPRVDRRGMYDEARQGFLDGSLSWTSSTVRTMAIGEGYVPDFSAHRVLDDVPKQYRLGTGDPLTGKAATDGIATASFTSKTSTITRKVEGILVFESTGNGSTSRLIAFSNLGANLPSHPHGGDVTASWSGAVFRI